MKQFSCFMCWQQSPRKSINHYLDQDRTWDRWAHPQGPSGCCCPTVQGESLAAVGAAAEGSTHCLPLRSRHFCTLLADRLLHSHWGLPPAGTTAGHRGFCQPHSTQAESLTDGCTTECWLKEDQEDIFITLVLVHCLLLHEVACNSWPTHSSVPTIVQGSLELPKARHTSPSQADTLRETQVQIMLQHEHRTWLQAHGNSAPKLCLTTGHGMRRVKLQTWKHSWRRARAAHHTGCAGCVRCQSDLTVPQGIAQKNTPFWTRPMRAKLHACLWKDSNNVHLGRGLWSDRLLFPSE